MLLELTKFSGQLTKWRVTSFAFHCPRELVFENKLVRNVFTRKSNYEKSLRCTVKL